ncbi:ligase-associated DNA damage response endonuclease PdeM [Massilia glaciei]|uniref:Ligase-associated DNA damage response endonuclease PdeM n=1 Tax=Massilia glaciei TaxID=1524097 RepID=A0A2U2I7C9_9BURK|nr:ligase-associated DNA damage response endonuclease PdeM [Massilia glaciei]PWF55654.1 ligase-associated DNA damage response endonuclease PdeM [Massilia glaciei]
MEIICANETLLLAQRAMVWPAQRLLVVADIHFGKAAAFRALGVPVPAGTTTQNLAMLDALMAAHTIDHILFLGDFLHAKTSHAVATLAAITAWRGRHRALQLTLVRGNHDDRAGDPHPGLEIAVVDEPHVIGPFAFCHHPQLSALGHVVAGHVHPVHRLAAAGDTARLPCFVIGEHCSVLPSFGAFTGGHPVEQTVAERLYVVAGDQVFAVPAPAPATLNGRRRRRL